VSSSISANAAPRGDLPRSLWALRALNFFMADIQAGIGPFLGVFLLRAGWQAGLIGTVMTVGGIAGLAATVPAGALIDATRHKRAFVVGSAICTLAASAIILLSTGFWPVAVSQLATAVAGAAIVPAVTGITLGIARQSGFNRQNGRNQAFNHAGNMVGAALSGLLGWKFGLPAVFYLAGVFGLLTIVSTLSIAPGAIDHAAARGVAEDGADAGRISGFGVLLSCRPLLILAAALACFHLGNGAMLPLYGLAVVAAGRGDPALFTAMTIVVAQAVMIVTALIAMRLAETRGYWLVLLISFLSLPVRGALAAHLIGWWGVYPVQFLDGIGAGLQGVAVPGLVACLLDGTGRINIGQGAVMTVQGVGAALSPALGGWMAQEIGYRPTFMILGGFALGSLALWLGYGAILRPACAGVRRSSASPLAVESP